MNKTLSLSSKPFKKSIELQNPCDFLKKRSSLFSKGLYFAVSRFEMKTFTNSF